MCENFNQILSLSKEIKPLFHWLFFLIFQHPKRQRPRGRDPTDVGCQEGERIHDKVPRLQRSKQGQTGLQRQFSLPLRSNGKQGDNRGENERLFYTYCFLAKHQARIYSRKLTGLLQKLTAMTNRFLFCPLAASRFSWPGQVIFVLFLTV